MTTLEQTIETIRALPPADRRRLQQWLQEQKRQDAAPPPAAQTEHADKGTPPAAPTPTTETVEQQIARFRKALKWIDEHRAEYLGQWVVLVGDRLISHGFDGRRVDEEAKAAGIEVPFITQIREEPEAFMTGITGPL